MTLNINKTKHQCNIDKKVKEHDDTLKEVISALSKLIKDTKDNETKKIGFSNFINE